MIIKGKSNNQIIFFPGSLQCGRAFEPNFLFLWPNSRVSITAPGDSSSLLPPDSEQEDDLNARLMEESSAFFSSGRLWDDGVILPQNTRKVKYHCTMHQCSLKKKKTHC